MPEHEEVLMKLKKTRKAFLPEYACGFFLLTLPVFAFMKGWQLPPLLSTTILIMGLVALCTAEFNRMLVSYKITPTKFTTIKGIIKRNKKNVHFHPLGFVPDINTQQSRIQRLLNFGTVFVQGGQNSIEIREINNPQEVMSLLEKLIEENRIISARKKEEAAQ
jgi:uncharacterized membrane protein YdbT with pleckstrin-like domain